MVTDSKSFVIENLNRLPNEFLRRLLLLLNREDKFTELLKMSERFGISLERDEMQIVFNCPEEIISARELLNIKFKSQE
jgi:hypothetical protein